MPEFHDSEFGDVTVRRSARAKSIRIRIKPSGAVMISAPYFVPIRTLKRFLDESRTSLRLHTDQADIPKYRDGDIVGKSHSLLVRNGAELTVKKEGLHIVVSLPSSHTIDEPRVQKLIRDSAQKALRLESRRYLTKRLEFVAKQHGFSYERVRFSHASSRWGSCSSTGTISLNIALMKLPFDLIDYVIIHELAHTKHMNHSKQFWQLVASIDPEYVNHRARLRTFNPSI